MLKSRFLKTSVSVALSALIGTAVPSVVAIVGVVVGVVGASQPITAQAAAPMVKTSQPGYYRVMLGDFEVTALSDGTFSAPVDKLLTNTTAEAVNEMMTTQHLKTPYDMSVNAFLVNTGAKLVLIDTGAAGLFGPSLGNLLTSLKAAGYQPEQVDEIYITHMHSDHVGGLMAGDKLAFPNATVRADKRDADFFLDPAKLEKAAAADKGNFQGPIASIGPYAKAGKFKPFDGDTELVPGVKAVATHGHTPGHTVYVVESQGQKLMLWGDLMHVAAVQFEKPAVTILFDSDSKAAAAQRKKIFALAAKEGYLVGAAHISFPGLGHMRADKEGYDWFPINYTPIK